MTVEKEYGEAAAWKWSQLRFEKEHFGARVVIKKEQLSFEIEQNGKQG
ncbi:MAG: hypothetical protein ACLRSW_05000 [Christensenellaceae bacterium]